MGKYLLSLFLLAAGMKAAQATEAKKRIFVIDSYHKEYLWSQETHQGFADAMLKLGYLENGQQVRQLWQNDALESKRAVFKVIWMDTKRKSDQQEIIKAGYWAHQEALKFKADIVFLGDDNATQHVGKAMRDGKVPVVFWGVNGTPVKYDLLDSYEFPGHSVTGVFQAGYYRQSLIFLKELHPNLKTFAILSDDSATGRAKTEKIKQLADRGLLPLKLEKAVATNRYADWQQIALALSKRVDAFFILNHQSLKDDKNRSVPGLEAGKWYLNNIKKPECSDEKQFVMEGMLSTVDDSGYQQGWVAAEMGHSFLIGSAIPATTPPTAPPPGPRIVNRQRAEQLGIKVPEGEKIEVIESSLALSH